MDKMYLGDSVYVEHDGFALILTTNNGYSDDPRNTIILEPDVYTTLTNYVKRLNKEDKDVQESK